MGGKKRKISVRKSWRINPRTRVKRSGKIYSRKRKKKEVKNQIDKDLS